MNNMNTVGSNGLEIKQNTNEERQYFDINVIQVTTRFIYYYINTYYFLNRTKICCEYIFILDKYGGFNDALLQAPELFYWTG